MQARCSVASLARKPETYDSPMRRTTCMRWFSTPGVEGRWRDEPLSAQRRGRRRSLLSLLRAATALCRRGTIVTVAGRHAKKRRPAGAGIERLAKSKWSGIEGARRTPFRRGMGQSRAMSREGNMIVRLWRGWTTAANADGDEELIRSTVAWHFDQRSTACSVWSLAAQGGRTEFMTVMWFTNHEAVVALPAPTGRQRPCPPRRALCFHASRRKRRL